MQADAQATQAKNPRLPRNNGNTLVGTISAADQVLTSSRSSRRGSPDVSGATNFAGQYLGPTSAHSFLQGAWKRLVQEHAEAYSHHDDVGAGDSG